MVSVICSDDASRRLLFLVEIGKDDVVEEVDDDDDDPSPFNFRLLCSGINCLAPRDDSVREVNSEDGSC